MDEKAKRPVSGWVCDIIKLISSKVLGCLSVKVVWWLFEIYCCCQRLFNFDFRLFYRVLSVHLYISRTVCLFYLKYFMKSYIIYMCVKGSCIKGNVVCKKKYIILAYRILSNLFKFYLWNCLFDNIFLLQPFITFRFFREFLRLLYYFVFCSESSQKIFMFVCLLQSHFAFNI